MSKRGARPIFFVCAAISEKGDLITKVINANTSLDAKKQFKEEFLVDPKEIMGPFTKKRTRVIENTRTLKFDTKSDKKSAIYNDWVVDAFPLTEPAEHVYLIFQKRIDEKKMAPPQGTVIVPVTDLRYL